MPIQVSIVPVTAYPQNCSVVKCEVKQLQVKIEGSQEEDAFWIDKLPEWCQKSGFPHADAFIPGHGSTSTFGQERQTNPFVADKRYG
ncbi:MAG: hydroxyacylglutathione hydrolase [Halieaceae bacterium]|jgi:hypothetical protein